MVEVAIKTMKPGTMSPEAFLGSDVLSVFFVTVFNLSVPKGLLMPRFNYLQI